MSRRRPGERRWGRMPPGTGRDATAVSWGQTPRYDAAPMIRETRVETTHRRVRVLEAGAGWPVVLLHAFPLNADMWRPQLEAVPDGWRLIAPDLPGFGGE